MQMEDRHTKTMDTFDEFNSEFSNAIREANQKLIC